MPVEECLGKTRMKAGEIIRHPEGRYVKLIGRADGDPDLWFWREVREDGFLGRLEYGYGW